MRRRGFSVVELTVTVAIVAVAAATALPYFGGMAARGKLRTATRELLGHVAEARTLARSGREGFAGWGEDDRVLQSGMRMVDTGSYEIFVDSNDTADGQGEVVVATHTVPENYALEMSQTEIRFRRNGTLSTNQDVTLTLVHSGLKLKNRIEVSFGGRMKLVPVAD
ncbi:MAG: GspH/FimT family pseudopilin [Myxococcota bacterium]